VAFPGTTALLGQTLRLLRRHWALALVLAAVPAIIGLSYQPLSGATSTSGQGNAGVVAQSLADLVTRAIPLGDLIREPSQRLHFDFLAQFLNAAIYTLAGVVATILLHRSLEPQAKRWRFMGQVRRLRAIIKWAGITTLVRLLYSAFYRANESGFGPGLLTNYIDALEYSFWGAVSFLVGVTIALRASDEPIRDGLLLGMGTLRSTFPLVLAMHLATETLYWFSFSTVGGMPSLEQQWLISFAANWIYSMALFAPYLLWRAADESMFERMAASTD